MGAEWPLFPPARPMDSTPPSLLERLRLPGEEAAWGRFVELYTPLLFFWARRLGLQEADAADLVQDVFRALVRKLPGFVYEPGKSFRATSAPSSSTSGATAGGVRPSPAGAWPKAR